MPKIRSPKPRGTKGAGKSKSLRIKLDGLVIHEESGNFQRKRVHRMPTPLTARRLEIECLSTHGAPVARVFEVRCYAD